MEVGFSPWMVGVGWCRVEVGFRPWMVGVGWCRVEVGLGVGMRVGRAALSGVGLGGSVGGGCVVVTGGRGREGRAEWGWLEVGVWWMWVDGSGDGDEVTFVGWREGRVVLEQLASGRQPSDNEPGKAATHTPAEGVG